MTKLDDLEKEVQQCAAALLPSIILSLLEEKEETGFCEKCLIHLVVYTRESISLKRFNRREADRLYCNRNWRMSERYTQAHQEAKDRFYTTPCKCGKREGDRWTKPPSRP